MIAKLKLVGQRFGQLVVVAEATQINGATRWLCKCDCGGEICVIGSNLTCGKIYSCSCQHRARRRASRITHGLTGTPLFNAWLNMHARCYKKDNPRFETYGSRGITVCPRWHDLKNFVTDMGPSWFEEGSLDRKNNDDGYTPENCRWATDAEQSRNKTTTKIRAEQVSVIQKMYRESGLSQEAVGAQFGLGRNTVKHVLRGIK